MLTYQQKLEIVKTVNADQKEVIRLLELRGYKIESRQGAGTEQFFKAKGREFQLWSNGKISEEWPSKFSGNFTDFLQKVEGMSSFLMAVDWVVNHPKPERKKILIKLK
ncbi:MAG: hypothetical protein JXK05_13360 [Campylobacterales bacterium]|nr:hypothetical protein [Campylobacterales bacterium]